MKGIEFYVSSNVSISWSPSGSATSGSNLLIDDIYISGQTAVEEKRFFAGAQNDRVDAYPNPFIQKTVIQLQIPNSRLQIGDAQLTIHNFSGRVVRTLPISNFQSPITKVTWDGTDDAGRKLPEGIYFAKWEKEKETRTLKLILLR